MKLFLALILLAIFAAVVHIAMRIETQLFGEYGETTARGRRLGIWISFGAVVIWLTVLVGLLYIESSLTVPIAVALGAVVFGVVFGCADNERDPEVEREIEEQMKRQGK